MVTQLASETSSVKTAMVSNQALNAADAGVHGMVEAIQADLALGAKLPDTPLVYKYPEAAGGPTTQYSVTLDQVIPDGSIDYYQITSTGTYDNGIERASRVVRAIAQGQPLADFASFSNYEVNQFGNPVWYLSSQYFNGPVYSGGPMRIAYATPGPSASPIFGSTVETANQPIWSPATPSSTPDWKNVIAGGQGAFDINSTGLALPQPATNIAVASEAWQGDSNNTFPNGFPSPPPGIYIDGQEASTATNPTETTGIFVNVLNGSSDGTATITSTVSNNGNTDTMKINSPTWSGGAYTVTISYASNFAATGDCSGTTTVTHAGNTKTFNGTPCGAPGPGVTNTGNGAIFVDGGIQFGTGAAPNTTFSGTFAFVTPDYQAWTQKNASAKNDITVLGNLAYDPSSAANDKIMLWANDIILNTNVVGVLIDASLIAGYPGEAWQDGHFASANCKKNGCGQTNQGVLNIFGSLVENARGAVGEVVGSQQYGFNRVIQFDQRFATSPPPFAPTTGTLAIIAEEDLGTSIP